MRLWLAAAGSVLTAACGVPTVILVPDDAGSDDVPEVAQGSDAASQSDAASASDSPNACLESVGCLGPLCDASAVCDAKYCGKCAPGFLCCTKAGLGSATCRPSPPCP